MRDVDLSLAVSYVPGAVCLLKMSVLLFLLWVASFQGENWYGVLGMLLWLDRHYQSEFSIVDTNNLLLSLYASYIIHILRDSGSIVRDHSSLLESALTLLWCLSCLYSLSYFLQVTVAPCKSFRNVHVSVESTLVCVACILFCVRTRESIWVYMARVYIFAILCLFWRYAVDLRNLRASATGKIRAPISVLFMPLLYGTPVLTMLFALGCCALICLRFVHVPNVAAVQAERVDEYVHSVVVESPLPPEESQESLEQMLKEAKARNFNAAI